MCAIENARRYQNDLKHRYFARDKYKHCALSCIVTTKCDVTSTLVIGLAKELYDIFGPGTADLMDIIANIYGIRLGMKLDNISDCKRSCSAVYPSFTPRSLVRQM